MDQPTVLLADDNPADVFLVRESLRTHNIEVNLRVFGDGAAAIQFIETSENDETIACPVLAILDLNLPKRSGLEIMARLRESATWRAMPVVIISSSRSPSLTGETPHPVDHFFNKPNDYDRFMELGGLVRRLMNRANVETHGTLPQVR